jgi:hypothetical protein
MQLNNFSEQMTFRQQLAREVFHAILPKEDLGKLHLLILSVLG